MDSRINRGSRRWSLVVTVGRRRNRHNRCGLPFMYSLSVLAARYSLAMKLQEGGCGVVCTSRNFPGGRSLGDAEQQADQQIAPQQPDELPGKFGRTAREQSGRLSLVHDFTQGSTAC